MLILVRVLDLRGIERYSQPRMKLRKRAKVEAIDERKQEKQSLETVDAVGQLERLGTKCDSTRLRKLPFASSAPVKPVRTCWANGTAKKTSVSNFDQFWSVKTHSLWKPKPKENSINERAEFRPAQAVRALSRAGRKLRSPTLRPP